jgi:hypothetical protein
MTEFSYVENDVDNTMRPVDIMRRILIALVAVIGLTSCSTDEPEYVAQRLSLNELNTAAGYVWFPTETSAYNPNPTMVADVSAAFSGVHKMYIYVRPSCSCKGTQKLFPQVMKTLLAANVPMDRVEVYSVRGTTDKHPYMDRIQLTTTPSFFIVRNDSLRAFIDDRDYTGSNADTLVALALKK